MRPRPLLSILTLAALTLTLASPPARAGCGLFGRLLHRRARAQAVCVPAGYGYGYTHHTWAAYSGGYATMGGCYGGYGGYAYEPPPPLYSTPCPSGPSGQGGPSPQCATGLCPNPPVPGKGFPVPPVPGKTPGQPTPGPGQHIDCKCGDPQCSHVFGQCQCNDPKCICHTREPLPGPAPPVAPVTPSRPHHGHRGAAPR